MSETLFAPNLKLAHYFTVISKIISTLKVTMQLYTHQGESMAAFFTKIDSLGGWPVGFPFVGRGHVLESQWPCTFSLKCRHDEWHTTMYSADDYYEWKLSSARLGTLRARYRKEMKQEILASLKD